MWQPIETAPKNGDGILLYCPGYPGDVQAGVWDARRAKWCILGCSSLSFAFDEDDMPTHWMPLPEPPLPNETTTP